MISCLFSNITYYYRRNNYFLIVDYGIIKYTGIIFYRNKIITYPFYLNITENYLYLAPKFLLKYTYNTYNKKRQFNFFNFVVRYRILSP